MASTHGLLYHRTCDVFCFQVAGYLKELVGDSGLQLNLGLVQTAYANGNSTTYINEQLVSDYMVLVDYLAPSFPLKVQILK